MKRKIKLIRKNLMWKINKARPSIRIIGIPEIQKPTNGTENACKGKRKENFLK